MFYSIIILHWTLNTTNYLRPKGRSFWKKRWRLSDTSVCFIWIWKPEVCEGVIGRSPRGVASTIEWEQHYPEYFHLQRLANVQLLPPVKRKSSLLLFGSFERIMGGKWIKTNAKHKWKRQETPVHLDSIQHHRDTSVHVARCVYRHLEKGMVTWIFNI